MRELNTFELVMKLVGPVQPLGESHTDEVRLANLMELVSVTSFLLGEIKRVSEVRDSHSSVKEAAVYATKYLASLLDDDGVF